MNEFDDRDDREEESEERPSRGLPGFLRKTIMSGLGAAAASTEIVAGITDELLRKNIKGMKFTQEAAEYIAEQSRIARKEIVEHVVGEVKKNFFTEEGMGNIVKSLGKMNINIEISFNEKEKGKVKIEPNISRRKSRKK